MTKKYWADWQKRIGETTQVRVYTGYSWVGYAQAHPLLNEFDKIIKASFHNDAVDLVIERHTEVINWSLRKRQQHVENEYTTLHRNEIKTIEFIKY